MDVEEFIKYVKDHSKEFIHYCEILISPDGEILMARPSHQEALIKVAQILLDMTREEVRGMISIEYSPMTFLIDKLGFISVWYNQAITPLHISEAQIEVMRALMKEEIISPMMDISYTNEYQLSLWRESVKQIFRVVKEDI